MVVGGQALRRSRHQRHRPVVQLGLVVGAHEEVSFGPCSPVLALYSLFKVLHTSSGGGEASVQSRSHGSGPGSCLPTASGQIVARRAGTSLQKTLVIGSRQGGGGPARVAGSRHPR